MLEAISWKEYWMLIAGAVGLYYGWWAIKYRAGLGWGGRKVKAPVADDRLARLYAEPAGGIMKEVKPRTEAGIEVDIKEAKTGAKVGGSGSVMLVPAVVEPEGGVFLSMVAADLLKAVGLLVEKAASESTEEGELRAGLRELVQRPPYCRLKGTAYQERVSDDIVQAVKSLGSTRLDAEQMREMWDG